MTETFCFRHPDRPAKRRCYQCKQPVCPTCQLKLDRHIFCGDECHEKWLAKAPAKAPASDFGSEISRVSGLLDDLDSRMHSLMEGARQKDEDTASTIERLNAEIGKVHSRLEDLDKSHDSLRQRLHHSEQDKAGGALGRLEELVGRLKQLEDERVIMAQAAKSAGNPDLEARFGRVEQNIAELMDSLNEAGRDESTLAAIERMDLALERLARLEGQQKDVAAELQDRVARVEGEARRPSLSLATMLKFALAAVVAFTVGFLAANGISKRKSGEPAAPAALAGSTEAPPNAVYDAGPEYLVPPTLDLTTSVQVLTNAKIAVTGYAPGAQSVTLYLNNREKASAAVSARGFAFPETELVMGPNVIQVKAVDSSGNVAFSLARIVNRISETRAAVDVSGINRMRGPRNQPWIALTIDAGSSNRRAQYILKVLKEKGIQTTFFLTGQFIERYPETVQSIVDGKHEVGNHTYSHPHCTTFTENRHHYTNISQEKFRQELSRTAELFKRLTGKTMAPWWRAPYGEHNPEILGWAEQVGYKHVEWCHTPINHDMLDWIADPGHRLYLDGPGLLARFQAIDGGKPGGASGAIILTHLGSDRQRDFLDQVLPAAIDSLRAKGYEFVNVSTMFGQ